MNYLIEVASATESFRVVIWIENFENGADAEAEALCRLLGERPGGTWRVSSVRALV